jgi:cytochrome b561
MTAPPAVASLLSVERTLTYVTGWLAVALLVAGVLVPSAVRLAGRREVRRPVWRWHYRLGWAAAAVAAVHAVVSITRGAVPLSAEIGLWMASAAAVLVGLEAALGRTLRTPRVASRRRLRRDHLVLTQVIGPLVALHVILNWHHVVSR